jgi:hypothetical protein
MKVSIGPICIEEKLSVRILLKHAFALFLTFPFVWKILSSAEISWQELVFYILSSWSGIYLAGIPLPEQKILYFRDKILLKWSIEEICFGVALIFVLVSQVDVSSTTEIIVEFLNNLKTTSGNADSEFIAALVKWLLYRIARISIWSTVWQHAAITVFSYALISTTLSIVF